MIVATRPDPTVRPPSRYLSLIHIYSVVDVVAACVMAYFMYSLIYAQEGAKSPRLARQVI